MKYNFNTGAYNRYMRDCENKKKLLQQIIEKANQKLDILDMENLAKDPWRTFQMAIIEKYGGSNFEFIGFDKMCDLMSYDPEPIRRLCVEYGKIKADIDSYTLKPLRTKESFYYVAKTKEEKEKLKYALTLVDIWEEHKKLFPRANPHKFIQAFHGILLPDYSDLDKVLVNPNYVEGKRLVHV